MKLFLVENEVMAVMSFLEAIKQMNWSYHVFPVPADGGGGDEECISHFLDEVCTTRPDVVVLDAALSASEEKLLDEMELEAEEVAEDSLSGFAYCRALANQRLGIPIVFLTQYGHGQVARMAVRAGADRVLMKRTRNEQLIAEIDGLVKALTPHDPAFYWPTRGQLETSRETWQHDLLRIALDRFYLNASGVRRFGLFTASMRGLLSPFFQGDGDAEKGLMLRLVKSQVLLSLVDPRLRDHVKHTGNVFWIGYRLLQDVAEFSEPTRLGGCCPCLYDGSGPLSARDQLLYAWTLASLFHDYGYVDERWDQLAGLVTSLVPHVRLEHSEVRSEATWNSNMHGLQEFVAGLVGDGHWLYRFVDVVIGCFGSEMECQGNGAGTKVLIDHGFVGAHRLLDMVPLGRLDAQKRKIVLHAALAIACHNYVDVVQKWKLGATCEGSLPVGVLPVWSLLTFCDSLQTWDRELGLDPVLTLTEGHDDLVERLVLSDTTFVSDSMICEFCTCRIPDVAMYELKMRMRYYVEAAGGVKAVCERLGDDIQRWIDSGRLRCVCDATGLSSLVRGEVVYELPMLAGTRKVIF